MKRTVCFLIAVIMLFTFVGCYRENNEINEQQVKNSSSKYTDTYENKEYDEDDIYTNTYILNKSSFKFHYPDCGSVQLMSASNKKVYKGNRSEVISMGYVACQRCCP